MSETLNKLNYQLIIDYIITNLVIECALQNAFQDSSYVKKTLKSL